MLDRNKITHIAFDADDTLWAHENVFVEAKATATEILTSYLFDADIEKELYRFEKKNLALFGYGVKGFMLSLIETAIELSNGAVSGREIQRIIELGKKMIQHPIDLLPYVNEAIDALKAHYPLLIITKGDLFDQENKIARSGLAASFSGIEIVSEKNPDAYQGVCKRYGINPTGLLMIGNSLKSDILPVLSIGGQAIHVPFKYTWHHEQASLEEDTAGFVKAKDLKSALSNILI